MTTRKRGLMTTIKYNGDVIEVAFEPKGLVFSRPNAYPVCVLRDPGETDEQIMGRYKSTLDERLIR
jgi:hypothetical protein